MADKERELVKERARKTQGIWGHVVGAAIATAAEFAVWNWVFPAGWKPDEPPIAVGILAVASVAAIGVYLGGKGEVLYRQLFVAPYEIISELQSKLAEYEEGPKFVIDPIEPITVGSVTKEEGGPEVGVMCIVQVRVTNEGQPGAALDWGAWVECEDGYKASLRKLESRDHTFRRGAVGKIPRGDFIWERTSGKVATGETVTGYFMGILPLEAKEHLTGSWQLMIACRDYRHEPTGIGLGFDSNGESAGVRSFTAPTLSRLGFDPDRRGAFLSGDSSSEQ